MTKETLQASSGEKLLQIRDNYETVPKPSEFGWRWYQDAAGVWWMCWAQPLFVDMYGPFEEGDKE